MATLGEIEDRITNLMSRSDLGGRIRDAINESVRYYSKRHFWFNTVDDSFVTSSGVQSYTLSQSMTFYDVEQVTINYAGSRYEVDKENLLTIRGLNVINNNGLPSRWALDRNRIMFDINVNGSYTTSVMFTRKYASLSATADTNDLLTYAEDLITQRSMWWLWAFKVRKPQMAQECKAAEMEALSCIAGETLDKQAKGHVTPTKF
ncbi:MAG TPA: hypothetical protein VFU31_24565 [Candidatus Binatia bacterium]|nr:hypothetical protein [Candidatus Binatia bacterium]